LAGINSTLFLKKKNPQIKIQKETLESKRRVANHIQVEEIKRRG
jgi:hypothetical protein